MMSSMANVFKTLGGVKRTFSTTSHHLRSSNKRTYEDAIVALNSLQPNAAELNKSIQIRQQQKHNDANFNLTDTEKFLERIEGFTMKSLDKLSVIHVAGSKGKGSVCAFTDAILRQHDIKTGLFTSPHLVHVTERIKLRGSSISKQLFTDYFFEVYDALQVKKDDESDLPSYFKFLQIMAFYIFVKENIDVAIVEVGIGGEYDSTNIVRNTEVVGITSLQLEHTQLLGETLDKIAWQKAGIIKESSHVYTMQQHPVCIQVINERFLEKKGKSLSVTPEFADYKWTRDMPDFTQTSEVNKCNFSLAAQLSARWLRNRSKLPEDVFVGDVLHSIDEKFVEAYTKCNFAGRFQRIEQDNQTMFLDGAHTKESMEICTTWFKKQIASSKDVINVLVFNVTGDRDSAAILSSLHSIQFDHICFTTNISTSQSDNGKCENFNGILKNSQLDRCIVHKDVWQKMSQSNIESQISVCPTIQQALEIIHDIKDNNFPAHVNVLFTGSLHLVGSTLSLLLNSSAKEMNLAETAETVKAKRIRS